MRVEIKQLDVIEGRPKWSPIPTVGLVGKSVLDYMLDTEKQVIAALYEGEQAIAFISNHITLVDKYAERGVSLHARELKDLLGTTVVPPVVGYVLEGSLVSIEKHVDAAH